MTTFKDRLSRAIRLLRSGEGPWLIWLFWAAPWVMVAAGVYAGVLLAGYLDDDLPVTPAVCVEALDAADQLLALDDRKLAIASQMLYAGEVGDVEAVAWLTRQLDGLNPATSRAAELWWPAQAECRRPR